VKKVYPVVISQGEKFLIASIPDLEIDTQGLSLVQAIEMARDAISLWCICRQDENQPLPAPSDLSAVERNPGDIVTLVDVDIGAYRRSLANRAVKKTLKVPSWLNEKAVEANINFSAVLQKALEKELQVAETATSR